MSDSKPVLWQLTISHYSEKARWALDHKGIDHVRRSPLPGMHIGVALWLTRGASPIFPILQLEGRTIADSTAVLAALEDAYPDPPLYPADAAQRTRALELEDFFDEELGPYMRVLPFYELIQEPQTFAQVASEAVPGPLGKAKPLIGAYARAYTSARWKANSEEEAAIARAKVVAALDRLEAELLANDGDYLAGESFSVADLAAASLFYILVMPPSSPLPPDSPIASGFERFRDGLSRRPGFLWVEEMYRRHRSPAGAGVSLVPPTA
jgi:glutathione S-transferase